MDNNIKVIKYQQGFPGLNKKFQSENPELYNKLIIAIRLRALQERGSRIVNVGKSTFGGTNITFKPVENITEYESEMKSILEAGKVMGIEFERAEK